MVEKVHGGNNLTNLETRTQIEGPSTSMEGWNTTWLGMPNIIPVET